MTQQSPLYRMPRKPGYLGGYHWRATLLGLFSLIIVSLLATQFIASQFKYQPALGIPILRRGQISVYQPFAWVIWGWRNSTSRDPRIRRPFSKAK